MNVSDTLANIKILLDRTININEFVIKCDCLSIDDICSIVSRRIKKLVIHRNTYNEMEMKMVLAKLDHLSKVKFVCGNPEEQSELFSKIIQWLHEEKKIFTYEEGENKHYLEISFEQTHVKKKRKKSD